MKHNKVLHSSKLLVLAAVGLTLLLGIASNKTEAGVYLLELDRGGTCSVTSTQDGVYTAAHCFGSGAQPEYDLVILADSVYPERLPVCDSLPKIGEIVTAEGYPGVFGGDNLRKSDHMILQYTNGVVIASGSIRVGESGGAVVTESGCVFAIVRGIALAENGYDVTFFTVLPQLLTEIHHGDI